MCQNRKCNLTLYENFLIANQNRYSGVELSKVEPTNDMSHDSVTRFLMREDFKPADLWRYAKPIVETVSPDHSRGYLIVDDTVLAKPYASKNELAFAQYSGQKHSFVNGINLVTLLYTKTQEHVPIDYRIYSPAHDGNTKNQHFMDMLQGAEKKQFTPAYVMMDSWYASLCNLKAVREKQWSFICGLKSNRLVSLAKNEYIHIADLDLDNNTVRRVWLKGYGFVLVCKTVFKHGDVRYLATSDLDLTDYDQLLSHWEKRWQIENYHRGLKQVVGIDRCSARKAPAQQTHIFAAIGAFLKLERARLFSSVSWYEQKALISRPATSAFLAIA